MDIIVPTPQNFNCQGTCPQWGGHIYLRSLTVHSGSKIKQGRYRNCPLFISPRILSKLVIRLYISFCTYLKITNDQTFFNSYSLFYFSLILQSKLCIYIFLLANFILLKCKYMIFYSLHSSLKTGQRYVLFGPYVTKYFS